MAASIVHSRSTEVAAVLDGKLVALGGLSYFVLAAQFMTVLMAAASMAPGYDLSGGAISDLGIIPETAPLFNASLILTGCLNIAAAGFLNLTERRGVLFLLSLVAGIGAIGAGLVTLHTPGTHGLFALVAFLCFNLQIVPMAWRLTGTLRALGFALAVIGFGFVVVMIIGDAGTPAIFGPIGHGGAERMIVYPPLFWLLAYGGHLMGLHRHSRNRHSGGHA